MTLTEMLINCETHYNLDQIDTAKEIFKGWLRDIPLGTLMDDSIFGQRIRKDLIIMVDEP